LNAAKRTMLFFLLLAIPAFLVPAQTSSSTTTTDTNNNFFDIGGAPQWVKDLRRWEIVAFGTIPFAMFLTTFGMDMFRWSKANGMNFSDEGRKYAPWPLKSAGAYSMTSKEMETTLLIAAGLCVTVAFTDLVINLIKRAKARKRAEALPHNATTINQKPLYEEESQAEEETQTQEEAQTEHTVKVQDDSAGDSGIPSPVPSS